MTFSIMKMIEKGIRGAVAGAIATGCAWLATKGIVDITPEQQLAVIGIIFGLLSSLTNFLKHKFPKIFGWL